MGYSRCILQAWGDCGCDIEFAGRQFRLTNAMVKWVKIGLKVLVVEILLWPTIR